MKRIIAFTLFTLAPLYIVAEDSARGQEQTTAAHAIASERLSNIMQNLNQTVTNTNDPDNIPEEIIEEDLDDMREAVEELLFHAEMLSTEIPGPDLDETGIVTFRALSGQLYTETLNIKQIAENYSVTDQELLYSAYERLYQTCAACHDLFSDP